MFRDNLSWYSLAGEGVYSRYVTYRNNDGDRTHSWVDKFERGQQELVITECRDRYSVGLTASYRTDGQRSICRRVVAEMTFDQYANLRSDSAIATIIGELDKEFRFTFQEVLQSAWEF